MIVIWLFLWYSVLVLGSFHYELKLSMKQTNEINSDDFNLLTNKITDNVEVDEQLYSRQLLVYGKAAQANLLNYHVGVICNGNSGESIAAEIIKNLALGGLGRLTVLPNILYSNTHNVKKLQGSVDLATYAKALNPRIQVATVKNLTEFITNDTFQLVISIGQSLQKNIELNRFCRDFNIKMIACNIEGNCGYVFNDFMDDFIVTDADGEQSRRVPLEKITIASPNDKTNDKYPNPILRLESIEEEVFSLGLGDLVEISWMDSFHRHLVTTSRVISVINRRVIEVMIDNSIQSEKLLYDVLSGKYSYIVEKAKEAMIGHHTTLRKQLRSPSFSSYNGCLSPKQDRAMSFCLLACFKAAESFSLNSTYPSYKEFRKQVLSKLVGLSIKDPEASVRLGGIGKDVIDRLSFNYWRSCLYGRACPATISVIGSLAAQETIKAATNIHRPINQFLMFESFDALYPQSIDENALLEPRFGNDPVEIIYGPEIAKELRQMKVFIVGAGAIGCELLKTFALLGVGEKNNVKDRFDESNSQHDGKIVITDMDYIERSNLNRQLLFRESHIGQSKAEVASEVIHQINPNINIEAYTQRVGTDTEEIFNHNFWKDIDIIATALDNIDARKYMDQQAVSKGKWLIDSGTLGTKGNTQVVIPYLSETYSSTTDPPEESIPLCTLKSFPYQPDHCVAWGKSIFDQLFSQDIMILADYLRFITNLKPNTSATQTHEAMDSYFHSINNEDLTRLMNLLPIAFSAYDHSILSNQSIESFLIKWSMRLFYQYFHQDVQSLLSQHPKDSLNDEDGSLFWTGSRRLPISLSYYDIKDESHYDFIISSSMIIGRIFQLNITEQSLHQELVTQIQSFSSSTIESVSTIESLIEPSFLDSTIESSLIRESFESLSDPSLISVSSIGYHFTSHLVSYSTIPIQSLPSVFHSYNNISIINNINNSLIDSAIELTDYYLSLLQSSSNSNAFINSSWTEMIQPELFDKDNLTLKHIDFISAASVLRMKVYQIPPLLGGKLAVRQIAGKIIPALATTTSIVSGLVCHEIIKIAIERIKYRQSIVENHKYSDINEHDDMNDFIPTTKEKSKPFSFLKKIFSKKSLKRKQSETSINMNNINMKQRLLRSSAKTSMNKHIIESIDQLKTFHQYQLIHKNDILSRFRNSFINIAQSLMTYVQPMEISSMSQSSFLPNYNAWDILFYHVNMSMDSMNDESDPNQINSNDSVYVFPVDYVLEHMTIDDLEQYIQSQYQHPMQVHSVSIEDILLYAQFMSSNDNQQNRSLGELLSIALDEDHEDEDMKKKITSSWLNRGYVDVDIIIERVRNDRDLDNEVEEDNEDATVQLPPLRVHVNGFISGDERYDLKKESSEIDDDVDSGEGHADRDEEDDQDESMQNSYRGDQHTTADLMDDMEIIESETNLASSGLLIDEVEDEDSSGEDEDEIDNE